ncbi:zinc finger MYM-type protein 1-like [Hydra vulgaris]|uniref:zinc finger MYM-type protein 1-like n=1 Tax=Hydra vulgaris TaxID=6087 RepID=UPI0032EA84D1
MSKIERDAVVLQGPPKNPLSFPRDSNKIKVPESVFHEITRNGEKINRDWLVWSATSKSFLCFPCSLFGSKQACEAGNNSHLLRWNGRINGNWRKLAEKVKGHQNNPHHRDNYIKWKTALESLGNQCGIDSSLEKLIRNEAARWREILKCILDVILFLALRNLSFRGSSKMIGDDDDGNFLATLELLAKHNKTLQLHLEEVSRCQQEGKQIIAHYLGWSSQIEFIKECGRIVYGAIIKEAHMAIYYSILVDGTPDVSHTEQIAFVLRFVYYGIDKKWVVKERFLGVESLDKKKGVDIAKLIIDVLNQNDIDLKNCGGQGYDNGANMSGVYKGVQAIILQRNPQAFYMPCSTHNLNLAGVHSLDSSVEMKNYFGRIQLLYNLFSGSPIRWKILTETAGLSLHQTSQTRWSARIEAVKPLVKRPREILLSLQKLRDLDLTADLLIDVKSLEKWIQSFEFIIMTTFWFKALQAINYVSVSFQSENITLDDEMKLMKILIEDLTRLRSSWPELINEAHLVASGLASYGFQSKLVQKRTRKRKTFYKEARNEVHFLENDEKQFEVNVFNTALNTLIQQIKDRFQASEKTTNSFSFLWLSESNSRSSEEKENEQPSLEEKCKTLAQMYVNDVDEDKLILEVRHLDTLKQANLFGPKEYLTSMKLLNGIYQKGLESIFESTCILLRIFNTIPVSIAEGERSFSKLGLVKTTLRSTMSQDRLTNLLVISIEHDLAKSLCYDEVIENFALNKARRVKFL